MKIEILEKQLKKGILSVKVEIKLRRYCSEPVDFFSDKDVIALLSTDYQILSVIQSNKISNTMRGGEKQVGTWKFSAKTIRKAPTRRKPKPKPPIKEEEVLPPPVTQPEPQKKVSTNTSFRGRISNIAKKNQKEN